MIKPRVFVCKMSQPCRLPVGELRKIVRLARRANYLVGPANREQLMELFETHADVHEDVAQVLEGPTTVPMLKAQRQMLKDTFHSENPTKMDRAALLRYIYFTASKYGWEYPDMDEYEQRAVIGKSCQKSRPIGKGPKPPAGILPKKDRPERALTRHQKFMRQEMRRPDVKAQYPDVKERFKYVSANWQENKERIGRDDRAREDRRRARQQALDDAQEAREERERRKRKATARRQKEIAAMEAKQNADRERARVSIAAAGRVPRRNPRRAASRR